MALVNVIGTAAGILTTAAFIPQILKIRKQGGEDLSYAMLAVYFIGVGLWFAYGLFLRAPAIVWTNAATDLLVGVAIVLKATHPGRPRTENSVAPVCAPPRNDAGSGFAAD